MVPLYCPDFCGYSRLYAYFQRFGAKTYKRELVVSGTLKKEYVVMLPSLQGLRWFSNTYKKKCQCTGDFQMVLNCQIPSFLVWDATSAVELCALAHQDKSRISKYSLYWLKSASCTYCPLLLMTLFPSSTITSLSLTHAQAVQTDPRLGVVFSVFKEHITELSRGYSHLWKNSWLTRNDFGSLWKIENIML